MLTDKDVKRSKRAKQRADYDKANTKGVYLKLNKNTDSDIIALLSDVTNKQGYIKALIRRDLSAELGSELYRYFEE